MNQFTIPNIPVAPDIDTLRLSITNALSKLVGQLNAQPTQLDAGGQRVLNVAWPTGPNDGVPLRYLKHFNDPPNQPIAKSQTGGGGGGPYSIVFSNGGTATSGNLSPAFIVGSDRNGAPEEGWLVAITAPSGSFTANFLFGTSVADCTHTMLATDLSIGSGSFGPVFLTSFTNGKTLTHGNVIIMKVTNGASAAVFTGGIVVKR